MIALRTEMTHGDKAKAKAAKSSKASAQKSSSKAGANGKGAGKTGGTTGKAVKTVAKKQGRGEKTAAAQKGSAPAKEHASTAAKAKERAPADSGGGSFSNPVIAAAFKRAIKKYPNALRKLTD